MGIGTMQEASEKLLGWKQDWRKRCALENSRPGRGSTFYHSLLAFFFVYAVLCSIFLAFSIEIEHLEPHWNSGKAYFKEKLYMGKSLLQAFCWFY